MATQTFLHTFSSLLISILLLQILFETSLASSPYCTPSACGLITNISYPFRLKGDPNHCGHRGNELTCENGVASLSINSQKYYVKAINYSRSTIRLADASVNNNTCSFPNSSLHGYDSIQRLTSYRYTLSYETKPVILGGRRYYSLLDNFQILNLMSCSYPLKNSSLVTLNISQCSYHPKPRYSYIKLGRMKASQVEEMCGVEVIVLTSWKFKNLSNVSLSEIHHSILYGFELDFDARVTISEPTWALFQDLSRAFRINSLGAVWVVLVILGVICTGICAPVMMIIGLWALSLVVYFITDHLLSYFVPNKLLSRSASDGLRNLLQSPIRRDLTQISIAILGLRFILFPLALSLLIWFLIYKFRRRHLSMYITIESFLQSDNNLAPIRYSYSDIKKMTRHFKDKLGEGGYGSVYKGKLRSGRDVAVKMLKKSEAAVKLVRKFGTDDQDFINEISTIGRIHHVNVVKLVGYCAQGSKRALIFDFMPNGSLEKYLFNREKTSSLNLGMKFEIAVGVARGIEYLHRGCDIQILHFDIKPHNVLLDDKFIPKISDFGLAKFCSTDKNTMTMTAARGTIGYVAPELISRSIGAVSYKADVYSFGMLLMEMVNLNRDLIGDRDDSNLHFPYWIYECFNQDKDIEIENDDEDDSTRSLMRKMTIVALWCIQMSPNNRPSMNKVLEMLEGDVERLQIPNYPSQSTQRLVNVDESCNTFSSDSVALLSSNDVSSCVEITIQK